MSCSRLLLLVLVLGLPAVAQQTPTDGREITPFWADQKWGGVAEVEDLLVQFTNEERRKKDLPPLKGLPELKQAARQHSQEMLREDYFSHTSPHAGWATVGQRAYRCGLWEGQAGENIVYMMTSGYTIGHAELAKEFMYGDHGWMNSKGHRENILNADYTHVGLGVAAAGGKYYATQVFAAPWYVFDELRLRDVGQSFELSGRAKVLAETNKVYVALDRELVESLPTKQGDYVRFKLLVPKSSGQRKMGLHPAKSATSFWLKFLFYLDTAKPLQQALIMPFD